MRLISSAADPADGAAQALDERHGRVEPELGHGPSDVEAAAVHLAGRRGAGMATIASGSAPAAVAVARSSSRIDTSVPVPAFVDPVRQGRGVRGGEVGRRDVADVDEVASLRAVAEHDRLPAGERARPSSQKSATTPA